MYTVFKQALASFISKGGIDGPVEAIYLLKNISAELKRRAETNPLGASSENFAAMAQLATNFNEACLFVHEKKWELPFAHGDESTTCYRLMQLVDDLGGSVYDDPISEILGVFQIPIKIPKENHNERI